MKKFLCLLLACLCLITAVGCSSGENTPEETSGYADTDGSDTDSGEAELKSGVPDDFSLNGKEIRILTRSNELRQMDVDGGGVYSGDEVYDAVYDRNMTVEDKLGVIIEVCPMDGDWYAFGQQMENSLLVGDDNWDIISAPGNATCTAQRDYLFVDLQNANYLTLDNPYWNKAAIDEVSIDGQKIRYLVGDISLSMHHYSGAMFFNKVKFENVGYSADELYQLVIDRKWTLEKLEEYSLMLFDDKNGDGATDDGDIAGFTIFTTEDAKYLEYGLDVRRYSRNSDGIVEMDYDLDRANLAVDKLLTLFNSTPGARYTRTTSRNYNLFTGGNTVFWGAFLGVASNANLRNMTDPYGIIPYPMLDENQKEYTGYIHDSAAYYCVPTTCSDVDASAAVLEALCFESYQSVISVYFEKAMKLKYVSDSQTGKCIDIIRATSKKHFLAEHNKMVEQGAFLIAKQLANGQNTFTSDYQGIVDVANHNIVDLVEKFNQLENQK